MPRTNPVLRFGLIGLIRRGWNGATAGTGVAVRALWANKLRAGLTTLGIVIGVTTVIGILSINNGLNLSVRREMDMMGARALYVSQMPWMSHDDWFLYRNRPPLSNWQYRRLRALVPFSAAIAPIEEERAKVELGDEQINDVRVRGTNSEFILVGGVEVARGRFFSAADVDHDRPYAVLGSEVALKLFPRDDPLLKNVWIRGAKYTVIGLLKPMGGFLGRSRDNIAIIPIGCFDRSFGLRRSLSVGIKVAEDVDLADAQEELSGIVRRVRGLRAAEKDNFSINQQQALEEMYDTVTGTLRSVIIGISLISLLVGGIGIMNIMLVSVTERTREIGVRKALGARRLTILLQFLFESVMLAGVGGAIGVALGFLAAYVVQVVTPLPAAPSLLAVLVGLGFSAAVGIFFGLYPAYRASRLDPIEALRYE